MDLEDPKALKEGLVLFEKDFQLAPNELQLDEQEAYGYDQAYAKIHRVVASLIDTDFPRLVNILYRIDVPEAELKKALATHEETPAQVITQMILARELQKVATRKKYS